jgi:hypothetical protein
MEVSGQLHARPLYSQGKSPWYLSDRWPGGPQNRSGHGGEEKNSQYLLVLEPPIIQSVDQGYTTELSRLLNQNDIYDEIKSIKIQGMLSIIQSKIFRRLV